MEHHEHLRSLGGFRVQYRGGPMDGRRETFERRPDAIGYGDDPSTGYIATDELEDGWRIFRWIRAEQPMEHDATVEDIEAIKRFHR